MPNKLVRPFGSRPLSALALPPEPGRPPQPVRPGLWLFAPSRDSQGGSSWLLESGASDLAFDLLIDCPGYSQANLDWLASRGPGLLLLTSREGHGRCRRVQQAIGWEVLVQEQEAYLLPGVAPLRSFGAESELSPEVRLLWTPGPTPGSCVVHSRGPELDVLFCGRLLAPVGPGALAPLRTARCFHWARQLASLETLRGWLPAGSPQWIACGGGLGALRGAKLVPEGAAALRSAP